MEESRYPFFPNDCPRCINCSLIIIPRIEERVVVATLQLESGFENFRRYIDERGGEVSKEACNDKLCFLDELRTFVAYRQRDSIMMGLCQHLTSASCCIHRLRRR